MAGSRAILGQFQHLEDLWEKSRLVLAPVCEVVSAGSKNGVAKVILGLSADEAPHCCSELG